MIAIESERELGLSVLQGLDTELKRRGDVFRAAGVDHIADYRRKSGQRMPRALVLVDEFQEFFTEDDAIATQAAQILDRLVRQGRAVGIHILLGPQTLAGAYSLARRKIDHRWPGRPTRSVTMIWNACGPWPRTVAAGPRSRRSSPRATRRPSSRRTARSGT